MENKAFRKLKANEIEVRIAQVNKGGVQLLLYKDARVDQNILDETFGIFGWKRAHQLIGDRLYCTVEIKDPATGEWISKQDVGTESYTEKEKGQASDSFKRACFNFGIGRELYTAPNIFFPKDKLDSYAENNGKCSCYDDFKVKDITYGDDQISSVTIECSHYGKLISSLTFENAQAVAEKASATAPKTAPQTPVNSTTPTENRTVAEKTMAATHTAQAPKTSNITPIKSAANSEFIGDDEVITIGNCRGKKFGEVKDSMQFASFLNWVKGSNSKYDRPDQQRQFDIFKKMSEQKGA